MNEKQKKFIDFILEFKADNGYSPSVREIAAGLGVASTSTVKNMLDKLEKDGLLIKSSGVARSVSAVEAEDRGIPVIGHIRAGSPIMAEEHIEGYVPIREFVKNSNGGFFLVVDGDSMKDKGILSGDYVFIRPQKDISNGQIGAFRINGEVTLKTFRRTNDGVFLMPANSEYKPIIISPDDNFEVIGRYVMLLRLTEKGYGLEPA